MKTVLLWWCFYSFVLYITVFDNTFYVMLCYADEACGRLAKSILVDKWIIRYWIVWYSLRWNHYTYLKIFTQPGVTQDLSHRGCKVSFLVQTLPRWAIRLLPFILIIIVVLLNSCILDRHVGETIQRFGKRMMQDPVFLFFYFNNY